MAILAIATTDRPTVYHLPTITYLVVCYRRHLNLQHWWGYPLPHSWGMFDLSAKQPSSCKVLNLQIGGHFCWFYFVGTGQLILKLMKVWNAPFLEIGGRFWQVHWEVPLNSTLFTVWRILFNLPTLHIACPIPFTWLGLRLDHCGFQTAYQRCCPHHANRWGYPLNIPNLGWSNPVGQVRDI